MAYFLSNAYGLDFLLSDLKLTSKRMSLPLYEDLDPDPDLVKSVSKNLLNKKLFWLQFTLKGILQEFWTFFRTTVRRKINDFFTIITPFFYARTEN